MNSPMTSHSSAVVLALLTLSVSLASCGLLASDDNPAISIPVRATVTFRPGPEDGKDAEVWDLDCASPYASTSGLCATVNEGDVSYFRAASWTYGGAPATHRAFLRFDLSDVDAGCSVTRAQLYLYHGALSGQYPSGDNGLYFHRVTEPWGEATVLWGNQPSVTTQSKDEDVVGVDRVESEEQDYEVDLTAMVKVWHNNPDFNFGIRISLSEEGRYRRVFFVSSENPDVEKRPQLIVHTACR